MLKNLGFFLIFFCFSFSILGLGQPEPSTSGTPGTLNPGNLPTQGGGQATPQNQLPISGSPNTPPTLSGIQAVLERQSPRQRRFPLFPTNQMEFYQAWYRWVLGATDLTVQVFLVEDPQEFMEGFTEPMTICPQRSYRGASFQIQDQTQLLVAYELETGSNQWVVFSFPDQDLPVCGFMDEFIQLYQFFIRTLPRVDQAQFPAVIGTMPR